MQTVIQETIDKARKNRELYGRSETATRDHLINPILNRLGWRTDNPDYVIPNLPSDEGGIPDYTLRKSGRTATFVEAKKLGTSLGSHIPQLAQYCYNQGVEFGILTSGREWMLLKTFEKGTKLSDRIVWQLDLNIDDEATISRTLASISYDAIQDLAKVIEKDKMLQLVWDTFLNSPDSLMGSISSVFVDHLEDKYPGVGFDNEHVSSFFEVRMRRLLRNTVVEAVEGGKEDTQPARRPLRPSTPRQGSRKAQSPSVEVWKVKVPELSDLTHLHSWKDVCDHLKIPVDGDSARRRLKEWVRRNRPTWPEVPEPLN